MFDPAGVFCRGLLIYAERYEESRQNFMTVVDGGGNCIAGFGKGDIAGLIYLYIAAFTQLLHGNTDAWLAVIHFIGNVDGADLAAAFL